MTGQSNRAALNDNNDEICITTWSLQTMQSARRIHSALTVMSLAALVALALALIATPAADAGNVPPPHCNPEIADALPPRLRRICAALYGIAEISNAVEQYLDDKSNFLLTFCCLRS